MNANLYGKLQLQFSAGADRVAIITERGESFSYADLELESARIANRLNEVAQTGDRVVVQVEKSVYALCLYLACLRAGLIYIPLNTAYLWREVEYFLNDSEATVFVSSTEIKDATGMLVKQQGITHHFSLDADGGGSLRSLKQNNFSGFDIVHSNTNDVATILYTSGTTGRAKGAMLSHSNLESNAQMLHKAWEWRTDDVLLHILPIFHVHGLFVACHTAWLSGSKIIFLSRPDIDDILGNLPAATVMMGVPTHYVRLMNDNRLNRRVCRSMRLFISGSAPLLTQTFESFKQLTGFEILERYGMTETVINTSNPVVGQRKPGTVGIPLAGIYCKIIGDNNKVADPGDIGTLVVTGPNVFQGYWRNPEKTKTEFTEDGYFITGDLAKMDTDGYISIVGRSKDLIISGGYNVYPKEIEQLIDALPDIKESAVIGLQHVEFGEAVTAIVVPETQTADETKIIQHLKHELAHYKVPKTIHFIDELPRNAMGKVLKHALREQYSTN